MIAAPLPFNEPERLAALKALDILDTLPEPEYDDFTLLASRICGTPIALISLIDADRQWFKSRVGLDTPETPRDQAFCTHAIGSKPPELLTVDDTLKDERFHDNPLVTGPPGIRFYAGAPLVLEGGFALGTLCVIDREPRHLERGQREALGALARQLTARLELRTANKKLADRTRELESLHAENNQLAGMVAHDLRNPLQVIDGYGKLMLNGLIGPVSSAQKTALEAVTRNCAFMLTLVNDLLSISRLNSGALELDRAQTALGRLVADNVDLNRLLAAAKNIHIETDLASDLPHVSVDAFKFEQVLNNLITNAIKFSHPGTVIRVSAHREGNHVHLEVADRGQGIPEAELSRLFTPFSKTSVKSTGGEPSTGLGLAIAKRIIEGHGGTIKVASTPGQGTTFTLTLPLTVS